MRKLPPDEASGISPLGRGKHSWLYREMAQLKTGEGLFIEFKDWKGKNAPYKVMRKTALKLNLTISYGRHPDDTGWVVKRLS
jgi:hypothetical protein